MVCCGSVKEADRTKLEENRSCTDIIFLILFICAWIVGFVLLSSAAKQGEPEQFFRGSDWNGTTCKEGQFQAYPDLTFFRAKICVDSCNATSTDSRMVFKYESIKFLTFCRPQFTKLNLTALKETFPSEDSANETSVLTEKLDALSNTAGETMADLQRTWGVIFASAFIALICSFIYAYLCQKWARGLVWGCIFITIVGGVLSGVMLMDRADPAKYPDSDPKRRDLMKILAYIAFGLTGLFALIVCCLRNRIAIAIRVVKEAAHAIQDMKAMMLFPLIPFVIAIGVFVMFLVATVYVYAVGEFKDVEIPERNSQLRANLGTTSVKVFETDGNFRNTFAAFFFHLLWNINFLIYFTYIVIAGAVAEWYFSRFDEAFEHKKRGDGDELLSNSPVSASVKRVLRYHLGTVALGALIIAIIQFIRACVKYIEEKSKGPEPNQLQKCMFCMIQCCLKCIESCLDKISKGAFIWCAIYGDSFAVSACSSFALLWANLARVAAINIVANSLLWVGKIVIAAASTGVCAVIIVKGIPADDINSPAMPLIVIFILTYAIATLFMVIFDTTIDTTFLCFLVDEKNNKGEMFAHPGLRKLVGDFSEKSKRAAAKQQGKRQDGTMPHSDEQINMAGDKEDGTDE